MNILNGSYRRALSYRNIDCFLDFRFVERLYIISFRRNNGTTYTAV